MKLEDLGYTKKWFDYGLLTEEILANQISECQNGEDQNLEHYRYGSFKNWLLRKGEFTNREISQFVELALEDSDQLMAGSAVKELFTHPNISDTQFIMIKTLLPKFGNWTLKLIQRVELKRRIENEPLTEEIVQCCINYQKQFNENNLIELIIDKAERMEILNLFTANDFGKGIRNRAIEKIRRIKK